MAQEHISVMVCGNYGYQTNLIGGQTIKTRVLKDAFVDVLGVENVYIVDSSTLFKYPIRFFCDVRKGFKECSQVIMLPGFRGLHILLPLFSSMETKMGKQSSICGYWGVVAGPSTAESPAK